MTMELAEIAIAAAESIAGTLEQDGDWLPACLTQTADGIVMIANPLDAPPDLLAAILREMGAKQVAMTLSAWTVKGELPPPDDDDGFQLPPSMREDRQETLVVSAVDDAGEAECWMAEIQRHDDSHPTLSEWENLTVVGGEIIEMLREAVPAAP